MTNKLIRFDITTMQKHTMFVCTGCVTCQNQMLRQTPPRSTSILPLFKNLAVVGMKRSRTDIDDPEIVKALEKMLNEQTDIIANHNTLIACTLLLHSPQ